MTVSGKLKENAISHGHNTIPVLQTNADLQPWELVIEVLTEVLVRLNQQSVFGLLLTNSHRNLVEP